MIQSQLQHQRGGNTKSCRRSNVRKLGNMLVSIQHHKPSLISRVGLIRTSVRNLKSKYLGELSEKRKLFESTDSDDSFADITELQPRKRGRPVLLGEELDQKVQTIINEVRNKGGNVNSRIVRALGK